MKKCLSLAVCLTSLLCVGCSKDHVDYVKANADEVWKSNGFTVIGYQGYAYGSGIPHTNLGGAQVWYTLKKNNDDTIVFQGSLKRWENEIHIYHLSAIDAIKSK